jgi:hypothetical protein
LLNPVKVKTPELLAVAVALAAPLRVTVAPLPPAAEIVPEMLNVEGGGWVELAVTKPEHPERIMTGSSITATNRNFRL